MSLHSYPTWQQMLFVNHADHQPIEDQMKVAKLMREIYEPLATEELYEVFWSHYKELEGIRPRWANPEDRDLMLCWFCQELYPEQIARRSEQFDHEEAWLKEQNEREALEIAEDNERNRVQEELKAAYDISFDHLDPKLTPLVRKQRPFNFHWWR